MNRFGVSGSSATGSSSSVAGLSKQAAVSRGIAPPSEEAESRRVEPSKAEVEAHCATELTGRNCKTVGGESTLSTLRIARTPHSPPPGARMGASRPTAQRRAFSTLTAEECIHPRWREAFRRGPLPDQRARFLVVLARHAVGRPVAWGTALATPPGPSSAAWCTQRLRWWGSSEVRRGHDVRLSTAPLGSRLGTGRAWCVACQQRAAHTAHSEYSE